MTPQEETAYLTQLLMRMARQPAGCNISEQGLKLTQASDFYRLSKRLQADGLATQDDPNYALHLALTPKGQQVAELPGGYADFVAQGIAQAWQAIKKEEEARWHTRLTTGAAIVSAVAAVVAIGISLWTNNSLDKTNAQLEALTKRVEVLESQAKQRHHP